MTRHPLLLALVLALLTAGACVVSVVGLTRPQPVVVDASGSVPAQAQQASAQQASVVQASVVQAAALLRSWDTARAAAWARGDARALSRLYARGSPAGRADRAMLRAWTAEGLRVEGMRTQLLAVEEVRRTPDRWTLRVTDRLLAATAVGSGVRRTLPVDVATSRLVVLRRVGDQWRVESVRTRSGGGG